MLEDVRVKLNPVLPWQKLHSTKKNSFYQQLDLNFSKMLHLEHGFVNLNLNSVALVRERTIPTERPLPVGDVSANFCW
jgi:hypothetical protein